MRSFFSLLPSPRKPLGLAEFTALMALISATAALSIDAMLPSLPDIAAEFSPNDVNRVQLVLTIFVLGMGAGVLFVGPISDAIGRKATLAWTLGLYCIGSIWAVYAHSLEALLLARFVQGLGVAGPRVVSVALVRDRFSGREMARVTSFIMMVFMLAPAVAPSIGKLIASFAGWQGVFWFFVLIALVTMTWLGVRQPETLAPENRRKLEFAPLLAAAREVARNGDVRLFTLVMTLGFGQMFALLSSSQQIYGEVFGMADSFPVWFALMALLAATATVINSMTVLRFGMRRLVTWAYTGQIAIVTLYLVLMLGDLLPEALKFPAFFIWSVSVFFMAGITFGNLNALAMQYMGHVAGMAASIIAGLSTVGAVMIAAPVGLMFNGTSIPVACGVLGCSVIALLLMRRTTPS
ncbi:multidrug effflux MFS transporter [Albirhodobacter sp. R86504]|uniref:multidrug effflux MFS transporter n=1 Tax=Albirhodobacter sp. R86504 TaxID=3093848 RepID=UPI00366E0843